MKQSPVIYEKKGRVAVIKICNPPVNVLTNDVRDGLYECTKKAQTVRKREDQGNCNSRQKRDAVFGAFGHCDRRVVALLLYRNADGRRLGRCSYR